MSPELISGKCYDNKSDIWYVYYIAMRNWYIYFIDVVIIILLCIRALGCLIYELASLKPPFDATNQLSLAVKINAGKFHRIPNKYSDELNNVIR
jgi:serine/threonine protein kinase